MRSTKELFQVLLDEDNYFETGLCHFIFVLWMNGIIYGHEYQLLDEYIKSHRPKNFHYFFCKIFRLDNIHFYWSPGKKKQRIKWINQQIKKL